MSTWYFGPPGNLRALECPEPGVQITDVRYGGVHQALSGARTVDSTGFKQEVSFNWDYLTESDYTFLDSLWKGHHKGPFPLINPLKKNRLSSDATRLMPSISPRASTTVSALDFSLVVVEQSPVQNAQRALWIGSWDPPNPMVRFDTHHKTPVRSGEQITCSVYAGIVGTAGSHSATLELQYWNHYKTPIHTVQTQSISLTDTWTRFSITRTLPSDVALVEFRFRGSSDEFQQYVMCPQIEVGATATAWEPGGGAPMMVMDRFSTESPRFPYRNISLTLGEA